MPDLQPDAKCAACGHALRYHYGDGGPCLCAFTLKSGKFADATVCPCSEFVRGN